MRKTLLGSLMFAALLSSGPLAAQTAVPVPSARPPMPPAMSTNGPAPATATAPATVSPAAKLIDLNSATKEEIETLPGIGAARSEAILKNRPYKGKDDIVAKAGVPQAVYDKIKDRLIARQKG
jgi:competence protein ComEA